MPEGDTIRRLADSLAKRFSGRRVTRSLFRHPQLATCDLSNSRLLGADAWGKHLLIRFSCRRTLHVHLKMTGRIYQRIVAEMHREQRRFEIDFDNGRITGVETPIVELLKTRDESHRLSHLGPDVCGCYDHREACNRLASAVGMPLTAALLNQRIVAGFGNIYAVETPFIVGVHPETPVDQLDGIEGLLTVAVGLIRTNARYGPQNTTGLRLRSTEHWVLSRNIFRCKCCGTPIERRRASATEWQRRVAWCPSCQPWENCCVNLRRAAKLLSLHPCRRMVDFAAGRLIGDTSHPVRTQW